jgi:hypothetical protein
MVSADEEISTLESDMHRENPSIVPIRQSVESDVRLRATTSRHFNDSTKVRCITAVRRLRNIVTPGPEEWWGD